MARIPSDFEQLDDNVLTQIALRLSPEALKIACTTNKKFQKVCRDPYFWGLKYERDFKEKLTLPSIKDWYLLKMRK